jgi:hypothetical protein
MPIKAQRTGGNVVPIYSQLRRWNGMDVHHHAPAALLVRITSNQNTVGWVDNFASTGIRAMGP